MKKELIKAIEEKIESLNKLDANGIIYWSQFKEFVADFKPTQPDLETRKQQFYNKLSQHLDTYPAKMLREFYDYWSEHNENGKKMRFEMEKTWHLSRRLARWHRTSKKDESAGEFKPNTTKYNR